VSKKQFDELVKTAKFEGYYEEAKPAFDELEKKLNHDVAYGLDRHEQVIRQILESEIVAAYYYQAGSIEAGLRNDKQLQEAIRLLKTPEEYRKILAPQKSKETSSVIKITKKSPENITFQSKKREILNAIA
jgi:carboxyl-terminal processing protease